MHSVLISRIAKSELFYSTGFSTTKGGLIRSILNPKPVGFKFFRDSMRFIALMVILGNIYLPLIVQVSLTIILYLHVCYFI